MPTPISQSEDAGTTSKPSVVRVEFPRSHGHKKYKRAVIPSTPRLALLSFLLSNAREEEASDRKCCNSVSVIFSASPRRSMNEIIVWGPAFGAGFFLEEAHRAISHMQIERFATWLDGRREKLMSIRWFGTWRCNKTWSSHLERGKNYELGIINRLKHIRRRVRPCLAAIFDHSSTTRPKNDAVQRREIFFF